MASYGRTDAVELVDSSNFHAFPEGDYDFKVIKLDWGRFEGSKKIAPCEVANYTLRVTDGTNSSDERYGIQLDTVMAWKATQFFKALGCIPADAEGKMAFPWDDAIGRSARCHVEPREWVGNDGNTRQGNNITRVMMAGAEGYGDAGADFD